MSYVLLKILSVPLKHSAEGNEEKNYKLATGPKTCKTYVHIPKRDKRREKEEERVRATAERDGQRQLRFCANFVGKPRKFAAI